MKYIHYARFCLWGLLFLSQPAFGQILWMEAQQKQGQTFLQDKIEGENLTTLSKVEKSINYHPAYTFEKPLNLKLKSTSLNRCQIFSVFLPDPNSREQLIWSFSKKNTDQLLMTDQRIADLAQGKYINFLNQDIPSPKLNCYQQVINHFPYDTLRFGQLPFDRRIPLQKFNGSLAELVIFDRVMVPISRQKLETALAIKYSIPLAIGVDYIHPNGATLFDNNDQQPFRFNLAGIGRSDGLHLNQKQSKSKFGGGTFTIALDSIYNLNRDNKASIEEGTFLLWGDNNALIDFERSDLNPPILKRQWKLFNHQMPSRLNAKIRLEHSSLIRTLQPGEFLWLAVKTESQEDFTTFYKLKSLTESAETDVISLPSQDQTTITFIKAPEFWIKPTVLQPTCDASQSGKIILRPVAGKAPYHYTIRRDTGKKPILDLIHDEPIEINKLIAGKYHLQVKDAHETIWESAIHLNPIDLQVPDLKTRYALGDKVELNTALPGQPTNTFLWTNPNGVKSIGPRIELTQVGTHFLSIERNGCQAVQSFEVLEFTNRIIDFALYPNPTYNRRFNLRATLENTGPYQIKITSIDGKTIFERDFPAAKFIEYSEYLPSTGPFIVTIKAGRSILSKEIISLNP